MAEPTGNQTAAVPHSEITGGCKDPSDTTARVAYAHSRTGMPLESWHRLEDHLRAVAERARRFASLWGAGEFAYLAGLWHDLGKYLPEFQQMLIESQQGERKRRVDHSSAGAIHARRFLRASLDHVAGSEALEPLELLLTAPIAGHHAGLPSTPDGLAARLEDRQELYQRVLEHLPDSNWLRGRLPPPPTHVVAVTGRERRLRCEFLVRMVFSALIDADRLDTAEDAELGKPAGLRPGELQASYASLPTLREAIDRAIDQMVASVDMARLQPLEATVFRYRQEVLAACRTAAELLPGIFTLDVATGGGKTLASLSFALRHAERHEKRGVIVVIPYTSVIEQAASIYREALGPRLGHNLVEHHSAMDERDNEDETPDTLRRRLATENWDAPLVITTGVQFFESLFARGPSSCRKLHNIANSVVVIDEAQTLPPELLVPTVWALNDLVAGYGTSVVLSTATQPALEAPFPALAGVRRIVGERIERPPDRVRVEVIDREAVAWEELAAELARPENARVLCIAHRRDDARELTKALDTRLGTGQVIHLSGNMCGAHRAKNLSEIRVRLEGDGPCRVVSTQLVEAGVDLDFPVVYRCLAGLDSLVQAAGRANREGRLGACGGLLKIFRATTKPPPGLPRIGADVAATMLQSAEMDDNALDLFNPATATRFFRRYYESIGDMDRGVTEMREHFRFEEVERAYRFIDDSGLSLVIPYHRDAEDAITQARCGISPRKALRRLQRFTVTIYPAQRRALVQADAVLPLFPGDEAASSSVLVLNRSALYDDQFGLNLLGLGPLAPEELIL